MPHTYRPSSVVVVPAITYLGPGHGSEAVRLEGSVPNFGRGKLP